MESVWWAIEMAGIAVLVPVIVVLIAAAIGSVVVDLLTLTLPLWATVLLWRLGAEPPFWFWMLALAGGVALYFGAYAHVHHKLNSWIQAHEPTGILRYAWPGTGIEGQDAKDLAWFVRIIHAGRIWIMLAGTLAVLGMLSRVRPAPGIDGSLSPSLPVLFTLMAVDIAVMAGGLIWLHHTGHRIRQGRLVRRR